MFAIGEINFIGIIYINYLILCYNIKGKRIKIIFVWISRGYNFNSDDIFKSVEKENKVDIFILLLISLFVYLIPRTGVDYLSSKSTKSLKGLLAVLIIFHHISQKITTGETFSNFTYMGWYIIALFFFLSGYGLFFQYSNNATYMKNFLRKRLTRIFIPFYVFIFIYVFYRAMLGEIINLDFFLSFWKEHNNIIYNGWFINSIIVLYIIFYVSFVKKNSKISVFILIALTLVYIFGKAYQNHGAWEYVSIMSFLLGMFWMKKRDAIDKLVEKNYFICLFSISILMYILQHYDVVMKKIGITNKYVYYGIVGNICTMVFVVYFLLLINKLNFSNKYLDFLGDISFEIYMIHGLVMHYLGSFFISSRLNDVIYTIVVLLASIFSAYYIHKIIVFLEKNLMKVT